MRPSTLIVALAALLLPATTPASTIVHPGFETGSLDPWFQGIGALDTPLDEFWSTTTTALQHVGGSA